MEGAGRQFNIKTSCYQYRDFHYKDETVMRPSYPIQTGPHLYIESAPGPFIDQMKNIQGMLGFFSGFAYLSVYNKFDQPAPATYRPELADEIIWNGMISIDPYQPSGPEWDAFTEEIIEELDDPLWASFPYLPENPSSDDIPHFAGNVFLFNILGPQERTTFCRYHFTVKKFISMSNSAYLC